MVVVTTTAKIQLRSDGSEKKVNQYKVDVELGKGAYGTVRRCKDNNGTYALKVMSRSFLKKQRFTVFNEDGPPGTRNALALAYDELELLKKLDHPNLIALIEVIDDPAQDPLYFVTTYCAGGEVMTWDGKASKFEISPKIKKIKGFQLGKNTHTYTTDQAYRIIFDVAKGLVYLHGLNIAHFDVKPANVILNASGQAKICDLGSAKIMELDDEGEHAEFTSFYGTDHFMPPEVTVDDARFAGTGCDVWALGCVAFALVTGNLPFFHASLMEMYKQIEEAPVVIPDSLDEGMQQLLGRLLDKDPVKRIELEELVPMMEKLVG